ncbi:MAG: hypothetical protein ACRD3G_08830 [Vicinamibacterales bacterium]
MTVYVLVREDQNEMGFVDAAVLGVFATQENAHAAQRVDEASARRKGLRSAMDPRIGDGEWDVSWGIEEHALA